MRRSEASINLRSAVARNLLRVRNMERNRAFQTARNAIDYIRRLDGIYHLFEYLRMLGEGGVVLDIGAGTSRGIHEISQSFLGDGLSFKATGLRLPSEVDQYIGHENYTVTSAEALRGISDNSVLGVLAVFSIAYSACPEMVVERLQDVLIPGGAVKAVFESPGQRMVDTHLPETRNGGLFGPLMKARGFDVAAKDDSSLLLGIKPRADGRAHPSASELLDRDQESRRVQITSYPNFSMELWNQVNKYN